MDALGDYILSMLGISPWDNGQFGSHLTVIYFGALALVGSFFVLHYAINGLKKKFYIVILWFICLVALFNTVFNTCIETKKVIAEDIEAIDFSTNSIMRYSLKEGQIEDFRVFIELSNYSTKEHNFYVFIHTSSFPYAKSGYIDLFDQYGKRAVFRLKGKESGLLEISMKDYKAIYLGNKGDGTYQQRISTISFVDASTGYVYTYRNDKNFGIILRR